MLYFGSLLFGINFAHGGTGVFDTDVAAPNMTAQIDLFEQLVKKHYGDIGLENSIALVTNSGNDYSAYMARNNGTLDPKDVMHFIDEVTTQLAANLKRIQALGVKKILYNVGQMNDESTNNSTVVVLDLCNAFLDILQGKDYESRFPEGLKGCCMGTSSEGYCAVVDEQWKPMYTVCKDPRKSFFWDMIHPTQAGWEAVYERLLPTLKLVE
ncbi:hypothetical protein MLD38_040406 [Melastoma candidum]|uniref:Uncharacterized protein n=1 Tax=Melastoma candidum TaxID=119954 RepID=A0ACB9L5L5_9MYRT|nr:hypothetical protein MLD38_040406 [Melastoma candidum]